MLNDGTVSKKQAAFGRPELKGYSTALRGSTRVLVPAPPSGHRAISLSLGEQQEAGAQKCSPVGPLGLWVRPGSACVETRMYPALRPSLPARSAFSQNRSVSSQEKELSCIDTQTPYIPEPSTCLNADGAP